MGVFSLGDTQCSTQAVPGMHLDYAYQNRQEVILLRHTGIRVPDEQRHDDAVICGGGRSLLQFRRGEI